MAVSKSALTFSAVAFALIFGGGAYFLSMTNALLKSQVEALASQALGVDVTLGNISIDASKGQVSNITIANPEGFSEEPAITIDQVDFDYTYDAQKTLTITLASTGHINTNIEVLPQTTNLVTLQKLSENSQVNWSLPKNAPKRVIIKELSAPNNTVTPLKTLQGDFKAEEHKAGAFIRKNIGEEEATSAHQTVIDIARTIIINARITAGSKHFYDGIDPQTLKFIALSQIEAAKYELNNEIEELGDKIGNKIKNIFQ